MINLLFKEHLWLTNHTFSAFWLRSSVVSVLISLISDISGTAGIKIKLIFEAVGAGALACHLLRRGAFGLALHPKRARTDHKVSKLFFDECYSNFPGITTSRFDSLLVKCQTRMSLWPQQL